MKDDAISRQAAIRWVKTECNPYGKPTLDYESGKRVIKHLEQMDAAQPERKTGRWIDETFEPFSPVFHPYKCNQCGEHSETHSNFCPNCGADMREDNK